jgi:hypothetical protein
MEDQEDQDIAEGKATPDVSPWFVVKVALGGLALHFAGYAADCAMAGDAAAAVFFAGWLFGVRNVGEDKAR